MQQHSDSPPSIGRVRNGLTWRHTRDDGNGGRHGMGDVARALGCHYEGAPFHVLERYAMKCRRYG